MTKTLIFWGLILSVAALWAGYWRMLQQWRKERTDLETFKMWVAKKAGENVEQRCQHCTAGPECPGYNTGVIYPCEHYEEGKYGTEK